VGGERLRGRIPFGKPRQPVRPHRRLYTLEGLHYSKFDTVFQVVCNEFSSIMLDEELRPFALKMLPICEPVFAKYVLTDDFAYTTDHDLLYTEITGTIAIHIEDYGI